MPRDPKIVSGVMARVKSQNTGPELALRKALTARGLRYRLHRADIHGKPDIVFISAKVAVFVDGDYWHGNQWRLRGHKSLAGQLSKVHNRRFWLAKIQRNMDRDRQTNSALRKAGWKVVRIWESRVNKSPDKAAERVVKAVAGRGGGRPPPP
jgi:DNA mismatch endonuclease (patch repair protein)